MSPQASTCPLCAAVFFIFDLTLNATVRGLEGPCVTGLAVCGPPANPCGFRLLVRCLTSDSTPAFPFCVIVYFTPIGTVRGREGLGRRRP